MSEPPLTQILQEIVRNLQDLVRSEFHLAKAEAREELGKMVRASVLLVAASAGAIFSVFFLLLSLVYALSLVWASWLAALAVAAGIALITLTIMRAALARLRTVRPAAPKTRASVKENVEWAKRQLK